MCIAIHSLTEADLLDLCFVRFEDEVMRMAGELEEKEKEYEQCVISLTAVVEMAKVALPQFLCVHALTAASDPIQRLACPDCR